ncbi:unnamed protein product [Porites evermanni]|uniref:C-type lectin domain-containing protein n=1 Tax=Porites evermanni TaxID=104178 RepID=A0ABN8SY18_9CNID|nr:unnamed protein product [Porites evermanni]
MTGEGLETVYEYVSSSEPAVIPTAVSTTSRTSTNQPSQQACQQDWICNGTSCYKLVKSSRLSWGKAKEECEKCKAGLVKVESLEENDFIKTKLLPTRNNGSYWIGLSDSANENDWMWTDGTKLDGYKNWGDNQPDNNKKQQNCVAIQIRKSDPDHYGKWHDRRCSQQRKYICENP